MSCLIVKKLSTDVHEINMTEFNKMKQAALHQQKEEIVLQTNNAERVKFATEMKIKQQQEAKKKVKVRA